MKTIIRIEHPKDGEGIWRSRNENDEYFIDSLSNYYEILDRYGLLPNPSMERIYFKEGVHFCAFKTVEH